VLMLHDISHARERSKREAVTATLRRGLCSTAALRPLYGESVFFQHDFQNPFSGEAVFLIESNDVELQVGYSCVTALPLWVTFVLRLYVVCCTVGYICVTAQTFCFLSGGDGRGGGACAARGSRPTGGTGGRHRCCGQQALPGGARARQRALQICLRGPLQPHPRGAHGGGRGGLPLRCAAPQNYHGNGENITKESQKEGENVTMLCRCR
jgi:hypothetical protein